MAFLDVFKAKNKPLADRLTNEKAGIPKSMPVTMPETIDFAALWTEPDAGGGLAAMVPWLNMGMLAVLLIMKMMGH